MESDLSDPYVYFDHFNESVLVILFRRFESIFHLVQANLCVFMFKLARANMSVTGKLLTFIFLCDKSHHSKYYTKKGKCAYCTQIYLDVAKQFGSNIYLKFWRLIQN